MGRLLSMARNDCCAVWPVISFSKLPSLCLSKWKVSVYTEQRYFYCVVYILILWISNRQHPHLEILSSFFLPLLIMCILKKYTFFVFLFSLQSPLAVPKRKVLRYEMVFSLAFRYYFKHHISSEQRFITFLLKEMGFKDILKFKILIAFAQTQL